MHAFCRIYTMYSLLSTLEHSKTCTCTHIYKAKIDAVFRESLFSIITAMAAHACVVSCTL